jgi:aryl-alcohol dehydrogenase-like predicted oxidoreductase
MRKRQLGQSTLNVSTFCLGAMYLGTKQSKNESFRLLDKFVEAGGNFIDTANIYAHWVPGGKGGESESIIGEWLKSRDNRNDVIIATKVGFQYQDVPRSLKADVIVDECNKSLMRLGIDTLDLYYAHNDDRYTPLEETLEAFYRLTKSGKVRFLGASNYLAWRLEEARWISQSNGWPEYCCIQQRHTYIRKKPGTTFDPQVAVNDDLIDYCRNRNLSLIAYSALLSGAYTRGDRIFQEQYISPDTDNRVKALQSISEEINRSPNQVILAWMLQSNPSVLPLIAASTIEQLQENIDSVEIGLSDEQMEKLNVAGPM